MNQELKHRNRLLMEILQKIRVIERSGIGVKRMFRMMLYNGKRPPEYESSGEYVKMRILNGQVDEYFTKFVRNLEGTTNELSLDEMLVISSLKVQREIDTVIASKICQRSVSEVRRILGKMLNKGFLEKTEKKKGVIFRLSRKVYGEFGETIAYFIEKGIDELRFRELVMEFVRKNRKINNYQCRELLGVNRHQAYRIFLYWCKENC